MGIGLTVLRCESLSLEAVACNHCGLTQPLRRDATTRAGGQGYCGRTVPAVRFVKTYTHKARGPHIKEQIIQLVLNDLGVCDTARVLGVRHNPVSSQLKKSADGVELNLNDAHPNASQPQPGPDVPGRRCS